MYSNHDRHRPKIQIVCILCGDERTVIRGMEDVCPCQDQDLNAEKVPTGTDLDGPDKPHPLWKACNKHFAQDNIDIHCAEKARKQALKF